MSTTPLLPDRHPQQDFFIADIFDNLPLKDDLASMEHPIFSLSTKTDTRDLQYKNGDVTVTIKPTSDGLPTIMDKDVLLYCGSLIMEEINKGNIPPRTIRISSRDLLVTTNRCTDGRGYQLLKNALKRLSGTTIFTDIETNKKRENSGFHLIDKYRIVENSNIKGRMVGLEITLSEWFYNSLVGKEVLTINRDYFRLRGPLERRIYEIARKHVGRQEQWSIYLENLRLKAGAASILRQFRRSIKKMAAADHLPDFHIEISDNDLVTLKRRKENVVPELPRSSSGIDIPPLKTETLERAKALVIQSGTGWDIYAIEDQFKEYVAAVGLPDSIDGAFMGFVKKKIQKHA